MKQDLERLLVQNDAFMVEGALNKNKLAELARQYNPELLNILMSDEEISNHFFSTLETGVLVFKKDVFLQFLNNKEFLPDSFTAYKTKIGLATGEKYLSENNDVVLNFPYKDCILEGGQTKDDAKRQEIFFNETLAPTEINRLLDDKVLTNFKRYDETGEHEVEELTDTDNLIIKGNNLIALHSLKKRFAGKVKLIYIDPPYNTGSDGFNYNDTFNHSTWLTFMRNRFEISKELLSEYGTIFVSLDDKEAHYCKILMDEIFGRENFIADICHKSRASVSNDKIISSSHNHLLFYAKNERKIFSIQKEYGISKDLSTFKDKDEFGYYKLVPVDGPGGAAKGNPFYEFLGIEKYWRFSKDRMQEMYEDGLIVKKGKSLYQKYYKTKAEQGRQTITTWWDEGYLTSSASSELRKTIESTFSNPKNESLLELILEFASQENDIILDFFMGSATTQAVAHKMNRQYIGIEQMDYIETVSVKRLEKVIEGEQGGISKSVDWQGGGSFVYCELKNDVQDFKNEILEATTKEKLLEVFELAKKSSFLSYRIDPKKLKKNEFEKLSLPEQKQLLSEIIDNNNLYVNYSDIDDSDYGISEEDKKLNHAFYGKEK
ncbi:DNA methyltransferase [Streptococcus anginosus]|uniref:DNA methyltransferase n=1 Tax=Streptococcus anginosus TaxID=1328 RepID=UPI002001B531|nr:site-specific DNA-methyltransferase [Streptococcus anginosus]